MAGYCSWRHVGCFQISHGGVGMSFRGVHSDDDLFVHYFSPLRLGCCSKLGSVGGIVLECLSASSRVIRASCLA